MKISFKGETRKIQDGVASIIVVTILVVILSLISVAFAKLMGRTLTSSSNRQQNSAAYYAAQSGVNEITSWIKKLLIDQSHVVTGCDDPLLVARLRPDLTTGDPDDAPTSYHCNFITATPSEVDYQAIPPNRTQVVKLSTTSRANHLLFSWQSTDRSKNNYSSANCSPPSLPDETTWNKNSCGPLLRLTLYPILTIPLGDVQIAPQQNSRTFFLYPVSSGGSSSFTYAATADGSLRPVTCSSSNPVPPPGFTFKISQIYDCNLAITSLTNYCGLGLCAPAMAYYYAVITPIYNQADVKILANRNTTTDTTFNGVQSVIDVTGKSGFASKRLQARINTSLGGSIDWIDNAIPDQALRSAETICKRLTVTPGGITLDPDIACGLKLP